MNQIEQTVFTLKILVADLNLTIYQLRQRIFELEAQIAQAEKEKECPTKSS